MTKLDGSKAEIIDWYYEAMKIALDVGAYIRNNQSFLESQFKEVHLWKKPRFDLDLTEVFLIHVITPNIYHPTINAYYYCNYKRIFFHGPIQRILLESY